MPGLRSVIAPLRRNPRINPAERHRIEEEALARRHQRERFMLERKYKALSRLDARERRSLETVIRREMQAMEAGHEQKAQTRHDQIEVNKLDITLPGGKPDASLAAKKREGKDAWKARQEKLAERYGQKQNRPKGYRHTREEP